jgi:CPA2 family monovalent cation:H+ antiporter-2
VGWLCQRLGLSVVVGFLTAGILIGPYTPPFALVTDIGRVDTLAQMGLVFLMFSIGLKLSLRRLERLGLSLLLAVSSGAAIIFYVTRLAGAVVGWSNRESLFLAAMLMVSSSSVISKILQETGSTHERAGQLAMGVTVLEDVVAVVMLTLLNSVVQFGGMASKPLGETLDCLGPSWCWRAWAVCCWCPGCCAAEHLGWGGIADAGVRGAAIRAGGGGAARGLLAGAGGVFARHHRGGDAAPHPGRADVRGACATCSARCFSWRSACKSTCICSVIRLGLDPGRGGVHAGRAAGAMTIGLAIIGTPVKDCAAHGLSVTPIGEFSFIIAQLGVMAAVVPRTFYPMAVGVSLV